MDISSGKAKIRQKLESKLKRTGTAIGNGSKDIQVVSKNLELNDNTEDDTEEGLEGKNVRETEKKKSINKQANSYKISKSSKDVESKVEGNSKIALEKRKKDSNNVETIASDVRDTAVKIGSLNSDRSFIVSIGEHRREIDLNLIKNLRTSANLSDFQKLLVQTDSDFVSTEDEFDSVLMIKNLNIKERSFFSFPDKLPHFYRLIPLSGTTGMAFLDDVNDTIDRNELLFIKPVQKSLCRTLNAVYLGIDYESERCHLKVDMLNSNSETYCRVSGLRDQEIIGTIVPGSRLDAIEVTTTSNNLKPIFEMVVNLIRVSSEIGHYLLIEKKANGEPHLMSKAYTGILPHQYSKMTGKIPFDDYERYPHVPEVIVQEYTSKPWFQAECEEIVNVPFCSFIKTNSRARKYLQRGVVNIDAITAECHANVMFDYHENILQLQEFNELLVSMASGFADFNSDGYLIHLCCYKIERENQDPMIREFQIFPRSLKYKYSYQLAEVLFNELKVIKIQCLKDEIQSVLSHVEFMSITDALSGFGLRINEHINSNQAMNAIIGSWTSLLTMVSDDRVAFKAALEFFPMYVNGITYEWYIGSRSPAKMLLAFLGLKVAFIMNPNLYAYNKHIKSALIYKFLLTFMPDETHAYINANGYGFQANGVRVDVATLHELEKENVLVTRFTLLNRIEARPPGLATPQWTTFCGILDYLNGDGLTWILEIAPNEYRIKDRRHRLPGRGSLPSYTSSTQTMAETIIRRGIQLASTYQRTYYSATIKIESSIDRSAFQEVVVWATKAAKSFGDFFSAYYCPVMTRIARSVLLHHDVLDPEDRWYYTVGIQENGNFLINHNVANAVYQNAQSFNLPTSLVFNPISPNEGLGLLTQVHSPGSAYRGVVDNPNPNEQTIDEYNKIMEMPPPFKTMQLYENLLYLSQNVCQTLRVVSMMSIGVLFERQPVLREMILNAVAAGTFKVVTTKLLLKYLGLVMDGEDALNSITINAHEVISRDIRMYAPEVVLIDGNGVAVETIVRHFDPCDRSMLVNLDLVANAVFGEAYGLIKLSTGVVYSERYLPILEFTSHHGLEGIPVRMLNTKKVIVRQDNSKEIWYYALIGDARERVTFSTQEELIDCIRLANNSTDFYFVVDKPRSMDADVWNLILRYVRDRICNLHLPYLRVMTSYGIGTEADVMDLAVRERLMLESLLSRSLIDVVEVKSYDTEIYRGQYRTREIIKPLTSDYDCEFPSFVTCVNSSASRERGQAANIQRFFPIPIDDQGLRPRVVYNGQCVMMLRYYPYALRTYQNIYTMNPCTLQQMVQVKVDVNLT